MTDHNQWDDSRLLDLLIDKRDTEARGRLDREAETRLEELRRVHTNLRALAEAEPAEGLSEAAMAGVIGRVEAAPEATPVVPLSRRRWRPIAVAAAVVVVAALAWTALGPSGVTRAVEAGVFGGLELVRGGETVVTPVDHRLEIRPGDVILSRGGGELDIGDGFFLKIGQNARLTCLQLADRGVTLALDTGRLRCERIKPARANLIIHAGNGLTMTASTGTVFAVQAMGKPDDQLEVDAGSVTVQCSASGGHVDEVTATSGPFSVQEQCPCHKLSPAKRAALEPCHHRNKERPEIRASLPTQTDPARALALARKHGFPVLVTREDGPGMSPCYRACCFVEFLRKRRGLGGVVWLSLDPERHADALARYNLAGRKNGVVVLNLRGEVVDRGHVESDDGMYATVLNLIRTGRAKCTR